MAEVNLDVAMQSTSEEILEKLKTDRTRYAVSDTVQQSLYTTETKFASATIFSMKAEYDGFIRIQFQARASSSGDMTVVLLKGSKNGFLQTSTTDYSIDFYKFLYSPSGTSFGQLTFSCDRLVSDFNVLMQSNTSRTFDFVIEVKKGEQIALYGHNRHNLSNYQLLIKNLKVMYDIEEV